MFSIFFNFSISSSSEESVIKLVSLAGIPWGLSSRGVEWIVPFLKKSFFFFLPSPQL
jgi:hypothetical protein